MEVLAKVPWLKVIIRVILFTETEQSDRFFIQKFMEGKQFRLVKKINEDRDTIFVKN